jgi:acyl-coenzyme A thioesterase PaaI-like protein
VPETIAPSTPETTSARRGASGARLSAQAGVAWRRLRLKLFTYLWPPYLGAGVRITRVADDLGSVDVELPLHFWNRNYVGTHFGGSLFAMSDPFFMIILIERLGPGYVVWDKAATIRYRKPGRGTVRARFEIPPERVEEIRRAADADGKVEPTFVARILDAQGEVVAEVEKLLSVKRRVAGR